MNNTALSPTKWITKFSVSFNNTVKILTPMLLQKKVQATLDLNKKEKAGSP